MPSNEHASLLRKSVIQWNKWRETNPIQKPSLSGADFHEADLFTANLENADLRDARLTDADVDGTDFTEANLYGVDLRKTDISNSIINGTKIPRKNLDGISLSLDQWEGLKLDPLGTFAGRRNTYKYVKSVINPTHFTLQGLKSHAPNDWEPQQRQLFDDVVAAIGDLYETLDAVTDSEEDIVPDNSNVRQKIDKALPKLSEGAKTFLANFGTTFGATVAVDIIKEMSTYWAVFCAGYAAGIAHDKLNPDNPCLP